MKKPWSFTFSFHICQAPPHTHNIPLSTPEHLEPISARNNTDYHDHDVHTNEGVLVSAAHRDQAQDLPILPHF
jgi:hypothetical protein